VKQVKYAFLPGWADFGSVFLASLEWKLQTISLPDNFEVNIEVKVCFLAS
jgi:hypothetical protein